MRLISIYPEHANLIKNRFKRYEYRKLLPKKAINNILKEKYIAVYETSPTSAITMVLVVDDIIVDEISNLWNTTRKYAGITKEYFIQYYGNRTKGVAIKIKKVLLVTTPIKITKIRADYPNFNPPQNFYNLSYEKYPLIYKKLIKITKNS